MAIKINDLENWESPITLDVQKLAEQIVEDRENKIMYTINEEIGIKLNKDQLYLAINNSREFYQKGYKDGYSRAKKDLINYLSKQRPDDEIGGIS